MKKLITILFVIIGFIAFGQSQGVKGDTLKIRGGGSFEAAVTMDSNLIHLVSDPIDSLDVVNYRTLMRNTGLWTESGTFLYPITLTNRVGIGTDHPVSNLHIMANDLGVDIDSYGSEADGYITMEAEDARLGLFSENQGGHGSAILLAEVNEGVFEDQWALGRHTSVATNKSMFVINYSDTTAYYSSGDVQTFMTIEPELSKTSLYGSFIVDSTVWIDYPYFKFDAANHEFGINVDHDMLHIFEVQANNNSTNTLFSVKDFGASKTGNNVYQDLTFEHYSYSTHNPTAAIRSTLRSGWNGEISLMTDDGVKGLEEKLTVMGNGYVGIGTTDPISLFNVNGDAIINDNLEVIDDVIVNGSVIVNEGVFIGLGSENITDGTFDTDIGAGNWVGTATIGATGYATFTATGANIYLQQFDLWTANDEDGNTYLLEYEILSNTLDDGHFRIDGYSALDITTQITIDQTVGVHKRNIIINGTGDANSITFWITTVSTSGIIVLDNVSLKKVSVDDGVSNLLVTNLTTLEVAHIADTLGIGTTTPAVELDVVGDAVISGDIKVLTQTNTVLSGSKTASFTHDAESGDIGAYALSTSSAVVLSIHNLSDGMQGTIFLDITTLPSSITVNTYSDAGSTGLTEVVLGVEPTRTASKASSITYTCANNGTATQVYLVYGQEY